MTLEEENVSPVVKDQDVKKLDFKSLHFAWFVGHSLVFSSAAIFFLSRLLFFPLGIFYRIAYLGVISSYGIVLHNAYKPVHRDGAYFKRLLLDENTQYLITAIYFLLSKRIAVSLLPFFIYSAFHVLEFLDTDLIPVLAPHQSNAQATIKNLIKQYYEQSMQLVAKIEVCGVMARLVLGLFVFRSSILSVLVYAHFIRMRYYMSSNMRAFLTEVGSKIDGLLTPPTAHPKIPPAVIQAYATVKAKLSKSPAPTTAAPAASSKKKL